MLISIVVLTCCQSNQPAEKIVVRTVYSVPPLYFPKFPEPKQTNLIPLDAHNQKVTDENTEIVNVIIPYWYWQLIVKYKVDVDNAEAFYNRCKQAEESKTAFN